MNDEIENLKFEKKFFKRKAKMLQDENDFLMLENKRLNDENERLKLENSEIIVLKNENNELENKFRNMFIENGKLVETFDLINQLMRNALDK